MRITYRTRGAKDYWLARWKEISVDNAMENLDAYPLKYANMIINSKEGKILEAGCGAGRILRYYHDNGHNIVGFDYIETVISKLKAVDPSLKVEVGDITNLKYKDTSFKYVLAFGLYHNLEHGLSDAINETYRILEKEGIVCASFRADNFQTKLTDWLADRKANRKFNKGEQKAFHKMNLTREEFKKLFVDAGFEINFLGPVENMPILYKFAIFRSTGHRNFNENIARSEGYRLSWIGTRIQNFLMKFLASHFSENVKLFFTLAITFFFFIC
jgi:SAM-dependent methyltransferase